MYRSSRLSPLPQKKSRQFLRLNNIYIIIPSRQYYFQSNSSPGARSASLLIFFFVFAISSNYVRSVTFHLVRFPAFSSPIPTTRVSFWPVSSDSSLSHKIYVFYHIWNRPIIQKTLDLFLHSTRSQIILRFVSPLKTPSLYNTDLKYTNL